MADTSAAVIGLLKDTDLLQRLADLALDRGGGVCVVRGAVTTSVAASVELCQGTDPDVFAEVDVAGYGGWIV